MAAESQSNRNRTVKLFGVIAKGGIFQCEYSEQLTNEELDDWRGRLKEWLTNYFFIRKPAHLSDEQNYWPWLQL